MNDIYFADGDNAGSKPLVLWSLFYEQKDPSDLKLPENFPEGVFVVPSADLALDFDEPIRLVRQILFENWFCTVRLLHDYEKSYHYVTESQHEWDGNWKAEYP